MRRVKIGYENILAETNRATLFYHKDNNDFWLPHSVFHIKERWLFVNENFAKQNNLKYKSLYNVPSQIKPTKASIIDELKY